MARVRRLEWSTTPYGWEAETPWGSYMIERANWPHAEADWYATHRCTTIDGCYYATDADAMAECQADFAKRVCECLEVGK